MIHVVVVLFMLAGGTDTREFDFNYPECDAKVLLDAGLADFVVSESAGGAAVYCGEI